LQEGLRCEGFDIGPTATPIVPVLIGPLEKTFLFWRKLFENGVFTNPVVPPAVPPSHCRLRTSLMATHTAQQIDHALEVFARLGKELGVMRGPMSPSINDECGLLVQGFDTPPTLMMPQNPPYYVDLHNRYGFRKAKDLLVYESTTTRLPERIVRAASVIAQRKGITLRALNMRRFKEEVELVKALYNEACEKNWGFLPLNEE